MEQLRKKTIKNAIILCLCFSFFGIFAISATIPTVMNHINGPIAWEDVDFSKDADGLYVTGTLYFIYDPYAQETEYGLATAYEYIIDADDTYYMGLRAESDDMDAAEALLQASYNYMDGIDDGTELVKYQYEVTGYITKMPEESLELYHEYLDYDSMTAEQQAQFLPYYLEVGRVGSFDIGSMLLFIGIGVVLIIIGIVSVINASKGKNQKPIYEYISNSTNPQAATARVEQFLANARELHNLKYDENFIGANLDGACVFGETDKLLWAYKQTTNHKKYFVTVSKSYAVNVAFTDGKIQTISVSSEENVNEILALLSQLCPRAIIGYSEQLEGLFKNNLRAFMDLKYYKPIEPDAEEAEVEENEEY